MSDLRAMIGFGRTRIWLNGATKEAVVLEVDSDGFPYSYVKCNVFDVQRALENELARRRATLDTPTEGQDGC